MARVSLNVINEDQSPERRAIYEVLGVEDSGASPRGSTYYGTLMKCPREFALTYVVGLRPERPHEALTVGWLYHYCLQRYYEQIKLGQPREGLRAMYDVIDIVGDEPGYTKTVNVLKNVLDGYIELYEDQDKNWKILAVEETLQYAYGPFELSARLDLLIEDGGFWITEHKCLPASAVINGAAGDRTTVGELVASGRAPTLRTVNADFRLEEHVASGPPEFTGVRDVFSVKLKSGRRLSCTGNHPVLTQRGWVPAVELRGSDYVAVPAHTSNGRTATTLTDAEVSFIGYMLGDGTLSSMRWTKSRGPTFDAFLRTLDAMSSAYTVTERVDRVPTVNVSKKSGAAMLLARLGLYAPDKDLTASHKCVPVELMKLNDIQAALLLAALWDTDGCVDCFVENGFAKPRVAYASRSAQLCLDIQTLLLQLGIPASVTMSSVAYGGERRSVATVKVVTRKGKLRFLDKVRLVKYSDAFLQSVRSAILPGDDRPIPVEFVASAVRELGGAQDQALANLLRRRRLNTTVQAGVLEQMLVRPGSSALANRLRGEIYWEPVESVIATGRERVYNLEVKPHHNFVVDEVVTHNTARAITDDLIDNYQLDFQILAQMWLATHTLDLSKYPRLRGIRVNIATKAQTPKYVRVEVCPSPAHLKAFERQVLDWRKLKDFFEKLNWPQSFGRCAGYARGYSKCQFYELCHGHPTTSVREWQEADAAPFGFIRVGDVQKDILEDI